LIPAFLLTRQWTDDKDGVRLDLWLSTSQGPLAVSIHQQRALFFIRQADEMAAKKLLASIHGVSVKQLQLKTFAQQAVSAVYFDSQQQLYRARDRLAQNGIACFEADIRPTERYLCERFITASIDVDADYNSEVLHNIRLQPGDYRPDFEVMSLDIESDYEKDTLFSIAFVTARVNRVLMIGEGQDNDFIEYVANERGLLTRWIEWVERIDPDILIGWNVINFDLRLLQKRAQVLGLPLAIGRMAAQPVWRQSQADSNHHFVLIPGRVVLDGIDTLRSATFSFPSFSLESVARELLGRGKLIHDAGHSYPLY
jgi:DNA polymerase-2